MTERRNEKLHLITASPSSPVSKVTAAGTTPTIANKKNKDDSSSVTSLTTADSVLRQDELDPSETSIDASSDASQRASLDFHFSKNHATSPHHRSLSCLSLGSASSSSYQRKGRPAGFRDRMQRRQSERQFRMDDETSSSHSIVSSPTRYQQQRQRLRRNPDLSSYLSNQGIDDKYIRNDDFLSQRNNRNRNTSLPSEEENVTTLRLVQKIRQLEQENAVQKESYAATLRNFQNNNKTVDSNKEKLLEEQLKEVNSKLAAVEQQADVWRLENETLQQRLCKSQTVVKELETQQKQHLEIIARLEQNQRNAIEKQSSHFQDVTTTTMTTTTTKTETETETETTPTNVIEILSQSSLSVPVGEQEGNKSINMVDRNEKLAKLKAFRRSREKSLKELVIEKQNSTTDVQACIINLHDELRVAKEVIRTQAICIESMKEQKQTERRHDQELSSSSMGAQIGGDCNSDVTPRRDFEAHFQALRFQYIQLELDRAYGEFQLRDRITEDALKFHRRLRHWKDQLQELQKQLDTKQLKLDRSAKQELAVQQDLQEVKRSYQNTLQQFAQTQDRLQELEHEVLCYKQRQNADTVSPPPPPSSTTTMSIPGSRDASAECLQQSILLQAAKDRKDSAGSQKSWGPRWTKFLQ